MKQLFKALIVLGILLQTPICTAEIIGQASWYSSKDACGVKTNNLPNCPTASGVSIYELEKGNYFFIAQNKLPLKSWVKVTNLENGKSIKARVMDRGGFEKYDRIADLSKASYYRLTDSKKGTITVSIKPLANANG